MKNIFYIGGKIKIALLGYEKINQKHIQEICHYHKRAEILRIYYLDSSNL